MAPGEIKCAAGSICTNFDYSHLKLVLLLLLAIALAILVIQVIAWASGDNIVRKWLRNYLTVL